jgi:hypothetical protein
MKWLVQDPATRSGDGILDAAGAAISDLLL